MTVLEEKRSQLLSLAHDLGCERRELAILGEGNVSTRIDDTSFLVKASGSNLGTLRPEETVLCRFAPLLELLREERASDLDVDHALTICKVDPSARRPSVEALFHAYLLSLPGINFVGHTHPVSVNALLCSHRAAEFAERRIFPDEVVCCGTASVLVPYTDPGLRLAQEISIRTQSHLADLGCLPKVVLLESHGIITFGTTPEAIKSAMFMAVKAAKIFAGAAALGGPMFLSRETIDRIAGRTDEHYRQAVLTGGAL